MPQTDSPQPSFSGGRRWLGALSTVLAVAGALALLVMSNYLASGHYYRSDLSIDAAFKLSGQTKSVLDSLTNDVKVTVFFDPHGENEQIYGLTTGLLEEYQNANPRRIHVQLLDYNRSVGLAKEFLAKLGLNGHVEKDFIAFECNDHYKLEMARQLADYDYSDILNGRSKYVRRSGFLGELRFTSDIYALTHPQSLKAYFLYGHGENNPGDPLGEPEKLGDLGYSKFAGILKDECDCPWDRLSLLGTNDIPHDCQLLIVAEPQPSEFLPAEVEKIASYLKNGGRLLALLSAPCSLEPMLARQWGVQLLNTRVVEKDPKFIVQQGSFFTAQYLPHPIINPLASDKTPVQMVWPRPVFPIEDHAKIPGAPEVNVLAATTSDAVDTNNRAGVYPLMAAIEQGVIKGVDTPHGGTRIVITGDSYIFDDQIIDSWAGNHEFAKLALDWLLQRPAIQIEGLGPHPIKQYTFYLTPSQNSEIRWLFLGGLPAGVLALGGLVWLRRRR